MSGELADRWQLVAFSINEEHRDDWLDVAVNRGFDPVDLMEIGHLFRLRAQALESMGVLIPQPADVQAGQPTSVKLVQFDAEIARPLLSTQRVLVYSRTGIWLGVRIDESMDPETGRTGYVLTAYPAAKQSPGEPG